MSRDTTAQVGYLVKRLQQEIRTAMDARLAERGATMATYAALAALAEEPGISNAALARRCFVTPQTMHRVVATLEEDGLVSRDADPDHGRVLRTRLTPAGRSLERGCRAAVDEVQERMLADLDDDDRATLVDLLVRCIDALDPTG
jgi:DNA-binding MarR family transcriptional regulator